jgi:hypothetical protein
MKFCCLPPATHVPCILQSQKKMWFLKLWLQMWLLLLIIFVVKNWSSMVRIQCHLTYKDVCLFVPYTNPHFWTDRNQTLHTSPPWSGRDRRVCMGPQYFTLPTFSAYFVVGSCQFIYSRWLRAPHYPAPALYPWCGVRWCDVTHGRLCNENAEKWTECVCVKMETWWDGKEVTNGLHL